MRVNNKRYEAIFYQLIENSNEVAKEELFPYLNSMYTIEELTNMSEKTRDEINQITYNFLIEKSSKKSVWFMISEYLGKYYIAMYYDNKYNRANGEDL